MNREIPITLLGNKEPDDGDAGRQQEGLVIAATCRITKNKLGGYKVPSQSGNGTYDVMPVNNRAVCECEDFELRDRPCKHIHAVKFFIQREGQTEKLRADAEVEDAKPRVTYSQNWPAYDQAQINEQAMFGQLLRELCDTIVQPPQQVGRPRLPLSDMVFAASTKVYSTFSGRRAMTNVRNARRSGQMDSLPSYTTISRYLRKPELTPILNALIEQSATPLSGIEHHFSPDSSGFSSSVYDRWYSHRWGREIKRIRWIKAHIISGAVTNVVASAHVDETEAHDTNFFEPLVRTTADNFDVQEVSADKAYITRANLHTVDDIGATPYIPFKSNAIARPVYGPVDSVWEKAFHYYHLNREEFLTHYHKRSNVETAFHMIKTKFGAAVRSKTATAQVNEVLTKILCHNICVLIQSMYELDIVPVFENELRSAA